MAATTTASIDISIGQPSVCLQWIETPGEHTPLRPNQAERSFSPG
jgi:hypothetical protein